jgi:hypothetical protein
VSAAAGGAVWACLGAVMAASYEQQAWLVSIAVSDLQHISLILTLHELPGSIFRCHTIFGIHLIHHTSSALFKASVLYSNILALPDALPKTSYPTPYR